MAAISGKDGSVTWNAGNVSHITHWTCTETANNSAWASSSTAGYKNRVAGVKDWRGTFSAKYDGTITPTVGQAAALVLKLDATEQLSGNAIIDSIELEVDIDEGEVVGYRCEFSGNGALTRT